MEGVLDLKFAKGKKWIRRYVVIDSSGCSPSSYRFHLQYPAEPQPGSLLIRHSLLLEHRNIIVKPISLPGRDYCLEIRRAGAQLLVAAAPSQLLYYLWINALKNPSIHQRESGYGTDDGQPPQLSDIISRNSTSDPVFNMEHQVLIDPIGGCRMDNSVCGCQQRDVQNSPMEEDIWAPPVPEKLYDIADEDMVTVTEDAVIVTEIKLPTIKGIENESDESHAASSDTSEDDIYDQIDRFRPTRRMKTPPPLPKLRNHTPQKPAASRKFRDVCSEVNKLIELIHTVHVSRPSVEPATNTNVGVVIGVLVDLAIGDCLQLPYTAVSNCVSKKVQAECTADSGYLQPQPQIQNSTNTQEPIYAKIMKRRRDNHSDPSLAM